MHIVFYTILREIHFELCKEGERMVESAYSEQMDQFEKS